MYPPSILPQDMKRWLDEKTALGANELVIFDVNTLFGNNWDNSTVSWMSELFQQVSMCPYLLLSTPLILT